MSTARHLLALLQNHVEGNSTQLYSTALQAAAREAELGHGNVAKKLRELVERGRAQEGIPQPGAVPLAQPKGDLASLLSVSYPQVRLNAMTLQVDQRARLERVLLEQMHHEKLQAHNLAPRRKLLLLGPPGTGKTMSASAMAGELHLPLFTILLEGVITKFMGETAQKLRMIFDTTSRTRGVYFFDEFDAIGARRTTGNDVGEIRRVLNSFLQLLENDRSQSIIMAATNHPDILDAALFRRFDDVLEYHLPDAAEIEKLVRGQLIGFNVDIAWQEVRTAAAGLSQADVVRAAQEAAKTSVLANIRHGGHSASADRTPNG